jgi:hypothetical protein
VIEKEPGYFLIDLSKLDSLTFREKKRLEALVRKAWRHQMLAKKDCSVFDPKDLPGFSPRQKELADISIRLVRARGRSSEICHGSRFASGSIYYYFSDIALSLQCEMEKEEKREKVCQTEIAVREAGELVFKAKLIGKIKENTAEGHLRGKILKDTAYGNWEYALRKEWDRHWSEELSDGKMVQKMQFVANL